MIDRCLLLLGTTLLAGGVLAGTAAAQPAAAPASEFAKDDVSVWTLQTENDFFSIGSENSDRYYSYSLRLGWTSPPSLVPDKLRQLGQTLWRDGTPRIAVDITHQAYTPDATRVLNPPLRDRPYAAVLMANFALVQDAPTTRSSLTLGLGLVGPAAGGRELQNNFHDLIGQRPARGWSTQLKNEPLLQLTSERVWRLSTGSVGPIETDVLPSLTAAVGNLRAYLQTGAIVRLGQGLQADYGPPVMRPGLTGGDYFSRVRPLAWYLFAGAGGRVVGHDVTLDGNTFTSSRSVKKNILVGQLQAGLAVMVYGMRLTYTHTLTTHEFSSQRHGLHQVGSLALSVRF